MPPKKTIDRNMANGSGDLFGIPASRSERDRCFDAIHRAYGQASPTREVIGGNYAEDFAGEARWSRALDFPVPGFSEFKGLRYIDFKDCTNVHVLLKDGNSLPMEGLGQKRLVDVKMAMDRFLVRNQSKKEHSKKNQVKF